MLRYIEATLKHQILGFLKTPDVLGSYVGTVFAQISCKKNNTFYLSVYGKERAKKCFYTRLVCSVRIFI